ncbi:MAG: DUF5060 domain-containing protein [Spirochaetales bacterium]|nr:DUF5060 domain-containing protein [Spirochaetales bacterium]
MSSVEKWDMFELDLKGPSDGNPFLDVEIGATFALGDRRTEVTGFYDGKGMYRVRFMPDTVGTWTYKTLSNQNVLSGLEGKFECTEAAGDNHGPVRVFDAIHFAYEDGRPYRPVGTTCYVWNHQGDALEGETLKTLKAAPFNKIRMCVFPKHYDFNKNEPQYYPFAGAALTDWDYARFNPEFFAHLESRIRGLMNLGIEADLILFHPYDRWGYSTMSQETDDLYLHYIVARLAAFRNVWWSFANEYDLMKEKTSLDWDRFFKIVWRNDHVQHLRSIHNCRGFYDHGKPWVTHCSVQHHNLDLVGTWINQYAKPVVVDECGYEGNIRHNWGNLTPQEMSNRFWLGFAQGGYVGHGETYLHPEDELWWSKGGKLYGQSPQRIAFLRSVIEDAPATGLRPAGLGNVTVCCSKTGEYYLYYFAERQPAEKSFTLPEERKFRAEIIDTWDMTITPVPGHFSGTFRLELPGKPYVAVRFIEN